MTTPPTCGAGVPPANPAARTPWQTGIDYRSRATLFGLPLLHVASGIDPLTGRGRTARGILAIGERAQGVVALGGFAVGVFAFGGFAAGIFAWGGFALALFAFAGLGVGLVAALGGMVVAPIAIGGTAIGYYAFGATAYGFFANGTNHFDPVAQHFFDPWAVPLLSMLPRLVAIAVPVLVAIMIAVPYYLRRRITRMRVSDRPPAERPGHLGEPRRNVMGNMEAVACAVQQPRCSRVAILCAVAGCILAAGFIPATR